MLVRSSGCLNHIKGTITDYTTIRITIRTKDNDHAGDEEFRSCRPSHLEQFTSSSVKPIAYDAQLDRI